MGCHDHGKEVWFPEKLCSIESLYVNPLNAELNPICHLVALLGGATIVVVSRLRVKLSSLIYYIHVND